MPKRPPVDDHKEQPGVTLLAVIDKTGSSRDGSWKLTLEIPMVEGAKAAALALQTEVVFRVNFQPVKDAEMPARKEPEPQPEERA